jgi:hypothetical protein
MISRNADEVTRSIRQRSERAVNKPSPCSSRRGPIAKCSTTRAAMVVRCGACRSGSIPPGRSSQVPRRRRSTDVSTSSLGRTARSASRSSAATRRTWARGRPWPTTRSACSRLRPMRSPPRATRCPGSQPCSSAGAGDRAGLSPEMIRLLARQHEGVHLGPEDRVVDSVHGEPLRHRSALTLRRRRVPCRGCSWP